MSPHISDEQMLALLHGELAGEMRAEARRHLAGCTQCAGALAREAALDEILWEARGDLRAPAAVVAARPARRRATGLLWWIAGGAAAAGATALGAGSLGGFSSASSATGVESLLAWHNLIFYIPLVAGLLLVLGSAFGGGDHAHDAGHDHDASHDHDRDHDRDAGGFLSVLGVGKVPLTIVLMLAALLFGGIGIILNTILGATGLPLVVYVPISVAGALAGMVALTGASARLLHRVAPTSETYLVSRRDFAGCTGTLLLPADATSGYAQIKDAEGNVHNIRCRAARGALAKGTRILVIEYDAETQLFLVDAEPAAE